MNRKWYGLLTQPNGVSVTLLCYPERLLWFLARHIWRLNVEKFATIWAANLGINGSCQSGSDRCRRVPPFIRQEGGVPPGRVSVQLFLIGKGAALRPMMLLWLALLPTSCIFDTSSCQLADKQRTVQWEVMHYHTDTRISHHAVTTQTLHWCHRDTSPCAAEWSKLVGQLARGRSPSIKVLWGVVNFLTHSNVVNCCTHTQQCRECSHRAMCGR